MATKMIGVEFGSSTVKLAVCSGGGVIQTAVERIPGDLIREGRVTAPAAMSELLRKMCRQHGIRPGPCALVLPRDLVISHRITMPLMSEGELMLNLPFEFRDFTGKNSAAYDYDYAVIRIGEEQMELFAAAVLREAVEEYESILKKAGFALKIAIPAEMAWLNLIHRAEVRPGKLCIVDVGHGATRVSIFTEDGFAMGREIDIAGAMLDELAAAHLKLDTAAARSRKEADAERCLSAEPLSRAYQALAFEVMKVITFFRYKDTAGGDPLTKLYFAGGSSAIPPLRDALLEATGLEGHFCGELLGTAPGPDERFWALAAGAAMQ